MTVDVVRVNGLLPQHIGRLVRRHILSPNGNMGQTVRPLPQHADCRLKISILWMVLEPDIYSIPKCLIHPFLASERPNICNWKAQR